MERRAFLYTQTLQTNRIVSQRVETSLHVGTHLDGPMHAADGAGDIASLPLTKLVHEGVIVDVSDVVDDWNIITPKHITDRMEVKRGDILILHTGYHRYYEGKPQQDLRRYFCMHPGGTRELAQWMHDTQISWWGIDAGSGDHPMNTTIRYMRPDLTHRFEEKVGQSVGDFFGEYEPSPEERAPREGRDLSDALPRLPGRVHPRRERRGRHREGPEHAVHHRGVPVEVRGRRGLSLPDPRISRRRPADGGGGPGDGGEEIGLKAYSEIGSRLYKDTGPSTPMKVRQGRARSGWRPRWPLCGPATAG